MTADIIIPVYRPDSRFKLTVERLLEQSITPSRIILINTEERYFRDFLAANPDFPEDSRIEVHHIRKADFDHGGTRRMAAELSTAEVFVCMTQDALPEDGSLLEQLLAPFDRPEVAVSYARQLPDRDCALIERYTRSFNYPDTSVIKSLEDLESMGIKTFFCSNVCAAYKKAVYEELGGFVSRTIFNEDMIMASGIVRSGRKIAYCAEARVIHSHNYTPLEELKRNFDLGVSQAEHPEVFEGIISEKEGLKLVKQTAFYLIHSGYAHLVGLLALKSAAKLIGFRLGKMYNKLPADVCRKLSMNKDYFE